MKLGQKIVFFGLACFLSLTMLFGGAVAANLVVNGDFEAGNSGSGISMEPPSGPGSGNLLFKKENCLGSLYAPLSGTLDRGFECRGCPGPADLCPLARPEDHKLTAQEQLEHLCHFISHTQYVKYAPGVLEFSP